MRFSNFDWVSYICSILSGLRDLYTEAKILHRDISLFNIMIGRDRHANGYRKGVLIDYDYALSEKWTDIISPVSPDV